MDATLETCGAIGWYLGKPNYKQVTIVDTPGLLAATSRGVLGSPIDNIISYLKKRPRKVNVFCILIHQQDYRIQHDTFSMLKLLDAAFQPEFWKNVVIVVTKWHMDQHSIDTRNKGNITEARVDYEITKMIQDHFEVTFHVPVLFLDAFYNNKSYIERQFFKINTKYLVQFTNKVKPYHTKMAKKGMLTELDQLRTNISAMKKDIAQKAVVIKKLESHKKELEEELIDLGAIDSKKKIRQLSDLEIALLVITILIVFTGLCYFIGLCCVACPIASCCRDQKTSHPDLEVPDFDPEINNVYEELKHYNTQREHSTSIYSQTEEQPDRIYVVQDRIYGSRIYSETVV